MKLEKSDKSRVAWISILQAIAIVAVVGGHIDLAGDHNPDYPVASWGDTMLQFQMPVFFFISGYLYVRSSLYNKSYKELLSSKLLRLGVPFLFITLVMFLFKLQLPQDLLSNPIELSIGYVLKMLFQPWDGPARHMWYLESLFTYFAITPLLKKSLLKGESIAAVIVIALLLPIISYYFMDDIKIFAIDRSFVYFLYFYLGMVVMKLDIIKHLQSKVVFVICAIPYIIGTFTQVPLQSIFGIAMIVSLSWLLSQKYESIFSSFSKYSYQIYLMHIPPIMICRMVYRHHLIGNETLWFALCWIGTLLVGIYLPVIVCKVFEKLPKQIRLLIGL